MTDAPEKRKTNKSGTSTAAKNRWNAKAYDSIHLTVPKGTREQIQSHVETYGIRDADGKAESVNNYIRRSIKEQMERDMENDA